MYKLLKTKFTARIFRTLVSATSSFGLKMVRHFPNPFEDYQPGSELVNKDEIIKNIEEHVGVITKRIQPSARTVEGGLYVGATGISYMFYYLSRNPLLSDKKVFFLEKSLEYLRPALETSAGDKTSFLLGNAGTYALATIIKKETGDVLFQEFLKKYKSLFNLYLNPNFLRCGGDEFFVGRAGYLAGALWISRELKKPVFTNGELYKICDIMVASGKEYSKNHGSPCPLMYHYYNTQYLGAAHGISFILQMLLTVPGYLDHNQSAAQDIKDTVDFILSLQTTEGNWPCCMEEIGMAEHKLVHWCHGAPGIVYLMAKAYLVYKDQKYLDACKKAAEVVWQKGLLRKGPGICHGIAGNAMVFLLLYRLTGDNKYLYKATSFAGFLNTDEFLRDARLPDNPESLYEGTAGTVCYLSDLLVPDKAEFPFQDVFSTYSF